ncbi:MAG: hypothetical protein P0S93_04045 [Candidatus Neptunochlamydia sp.]|nr:hypothetical protein [Candidatus Neptunochlamydia sp.]
MVLIQDILKCCEIVCPLYFEVNLFNGGTYDIAIIHVSHYCLQTLAVVDSDSFKVSMKKAPSSPSKSFTGRLHIMPSCLIKLTVDMQIRQNHGMRFTNKSVALEVGKWSRFVGTFDEAGTSRK